jgi:hypothetical protein
MIAAPVWLVLGPGGKVALPLGLLFCKHDDMTKARVSDNKKLGRPATGVGLLIGLRWHEPDLALIDAWRRKQDGLPSRAEAIRRLVELGLASKGSKAKG